MLNLGLTLVSALIPIYWVKDLQASDTWVGYFNAALSAATLVSYLPWTRIKRRYGARWVLIPSVIGTALYPALLSLARTPAAVLPAIAFNGLAGSGLNLAFFDALLEVCPPRKQARFVAINMTALHLMGVIGPPIGATLVNWMPIRWVMVIGTVDRAARRAHLWHFRLSDEHPSPPASRQTSRLQTRGAGRAGSNAHEPTTTEDKDR